MTALKYSKDEDLHLYLIERTKNMDHVDICGRNYIMNAMLNDVSEIIQLILIDCVSLDDTNTFRLSLRLKTSENVRLALLEKTNNIDFIDSDGYNTIMSVLKCRNMGTRFILALIEKSTINKSEDIFANRYGHDEIVTNAIEAKFNSQSE